MYRGLLKILFLFPPESVHYFSMNALRFCCFFAIGRRLLAKQFCYEAPGLQKNLFGLTFRNPVGLGAGFDKNARYLDELQALGFGFVEIGTVTPLPQQGNEKPRLFRLPSDRGLINRMGFNNDGVKVIARRLKGWREKKLHNANFTTLAENQGRFIVGGNIGKNKVTSNEDAWKDYEICFRELFDCVDYFVVNVSSPNTPGLRALQDKDSLRKILSHLQIINRLQAIPKPLLLKIAPDLTTEQLDDVIELCLEIKLDGIVATNTTISREGLETRAGEIEQIGAGGLSGGPLREKASEVARYIFSKSNAAIPVIGSGGIFSAEDATSRLQAGAALIQLWTGFIYEGPSLIKRINQAIFNQEQHS